MKVSQKKILAGAGVVALTIGFLIVNPLKSVDEKLMSECLQRIPFVWLPAAEAQKSCRIEVDIETGKLTKETLPKPDVNAVGKEVKAPSKTESVDEITASYIEEATDLSKTSCASSKGYTADMTRLDLMARGNEYMKKNGVSEEKQNEFMSLLVKCAE